MNITARIAQQLHETVQGHGFHGQSLRELLEGVTAAQAITKPIPGSHSIWETLLHIHVWLELCADACAGDPIPPWPFEIEKDWPPPSGNEADWKRDVEATYASAERLRQAFAKLGDARLETLVPGRDYDFFLLLSGEIQHTIWHMGQMLVVKKAISAQHSAFSQ